MRSVRSHFVLGEARVITINSPWIGVDLDRTLARRESGDPISQIGEPVLPMVERVRCWISNGRRVKIITARVSSLHNDAEEQRLMIQAWCEMFLGHRLEVTCEKDSRMIELWDDLAVRVEENTGRQLSPSVTWTDATPVTESVPDDLISDLEITETWVKIKSILSVVLMEHLPACDETTRLLDFMSKHWSGHAPREAEFDKLMTEKTLITRDRDKFKRLLNIPTSGLQKRTKCPSCGKLSRITTAGCDHCDLEDK